MHTETQYVSRMLFYFDFPTPAFSDSSILPEELASQSVRLKEEQLRREEEKVRKYFINFNNSDSMLSAARN